MKRTLLLLMAPLFALALFAPAATAQDDDGNDDAALPETGGPALLAPIAGALLMAGRPQASWPCGAIAKTLSKL